jgi:hypothetical protein
MKVLIKKLLRENLLGEEYDGHNLYGYHVTLNNPKTIESIKLNGFKIGGGDMEGRGFYSFYNLERACGYSSKQGSTNRIIKFKIVDINNILILEMNIAKEILGVEYHIVNQLEKIYGLDYCYNNSIYTSLTKEQYIDELNKIENMDARDIGPEFFTMHTKDFESKINVINYGSYGMQFRINDVNIVKPIGVYELEQFTDNIINYIKF